MLKYKWIYNIGHAIIYFRGGIKMKLKKLLSGVAAALIALSSIGIASLTTVSAAEKLNTSIFKPTMEGKEVKLIEDYSNSTIWSAIVGKTEFYLTFDVTAVSETVYASVCFWGNNYEYQNWKPSEASPAVSISETGSYTVKLDCTKTSSDGNSTDSFSSDPVTYLSIAFFTNEAGSEDANNVVVANFTGAYDSNPNAAYGPVESDEPKASEIFRKVYEEAVAILENDADAYTVESIAELREAKNNFQYLLEDGAEATDEELLEAVDAIQKAIDALVVKTEEPSSDHDPSLDPSSEPSSDPIDSKAKEVKIDSTKAPYTNITSPAQRASEAKATAEKAIKQAKIVSLTAKAKGKKKITVSWKKVAKAAGYEVQASTKKNFKKDVIKKATTKNKIVFKKLKSKKKYFVRVRAYTTYKDAKGKTQKVYGKWFKSKKKVKVK